MDPGAMLALGAATAVLVAIPGPNVALFIANTLAHGTRYGVATVLGTTLGVAVQLVIVVLGLAVLLDLATSALVWLRWLGVAYLITLGVQSWRRGRAEAPDARPGARALGPVFWQGLLLAVINPKTLLFAAAFLPQFVRAETGAALVLALPAAIYLGVILVGDLAWVASAHVARPLILRLGRLRHRVTGALYVGAGIGLALARIGR